MTFNYKDEVKFDHPIYLLDGSSIDRGFVVEVYENEVSIEIKIDENSTRRIWRNTDEVHSLEY